MMKFRSALFTIFTLTSTAVVPLTAYQNNEHSSRGIPTIKEVENELKKIEGEYKKAAALFNPWYAGPLLTPSAHNVPPGGFNFQPYYFYTRITNEYDSNGSKMDVTATTENLFQAILQAGLTHRLDFSLVAGCQVTTKRDTTKAVYLDTATELGFQVLSESHYGPAIRGIVEVVFPTGRYRHLDPVDSDIEAAGLGAYQFGLGFAASKVIWWLTPHPFQLRFSCQYDIPTHVHVKGFNAFGGGVGTDGIVHIGNIISTFTSIEYSVTKNWVLAVDFAYSYKNKSTFHGTPGLNSDGSPAENGSPSSYSLAVAPAIEYNVSGHLGFLIGGETLLWGRNAPNASSAIFTFTWSW